MRYLWLVVFYLSLPPIPQVLLKKSKFKKATIIDLQYNTKKLFIFILYILYSAQEMGSCEK
jgi:hypothetical protein